MSSSAHLRWDEGEGVVAEDWEDFCTAHRITYSPSTIGGNVFYAGQVEIHFGRGYSGTEPPDYAEEISFGTFHGGEAMPEVARLTRALWQAHGGRLSCDPEIRALIIREDEVTTLRADVRRWAFASKAPMPPTDMKVLATIEFPGVVYLAHEHATGLPSEVADVRAPWIKGQVPGGQLILYGVPLGKVAHVRPEFDALYEMGNETAPEWVTRHTSVDLVLDLGALLSHA